jgi:hypothetical protein
MPALMSRETLTALAVVVVALGGTLLGYRVWADHTAAEELAAREERQAARHAEEAAALAELREESAEAMPEMLAGVALGQSVDEVRRARPGGALSPSTSRSDPGLSLFEEHLPNGAEIMYGFDADDGTLVQVQVLSLLPTLEGLTPHLAAMNERYGSPTGIWDCPLTGNLPTRRFTWRRSHTTIADVMLIYGERISLTLYIATSDAMGLSLRRSHCVPTPADQLDQFPTASPEQVQRAVQEEDAP